MSDKSTNRSPVLGAWFCLFAAILLFAPLAEAAWTARAAACCTKDHCNIPQHHHSQQPEVAAECDHHDTGLMPCAMNCCQETERALNIAIAFVLPSVTTLTAPAVTGAAVQDLQTVNYARTLDVLSPPPRSAITTL
ncbi:MAG: hypothetical protein M3N22_04430 [Acidobacteriota bacterium]|nr:hypothetical protein [Acidobacteriota bacterium]